MERKLTSLLMEFAHALGTDFSLPAILDLLAHRIVDLLPISGAGVMVMRDHDELHFLAASNATIERIETLQNTFDEGPCLQAYRSGQPVAVPDLASDRQFPKFSPHAVQAGLAAVFTFPLQLGGKRFGALDLYRDSPGELSPEDTQTAQTLAEVAAAYIYNARARAEADDNVVELRRRTLHDPLTGLPNRALFVELVGQALARANRTEGSVAVLFIDIDDFKSVNDRYGHHVGDQFLIAVAQRLDAVSRSGEPAARLAGDEFAVLCHEVTDPAQAHRVAERIAASLSRPLLVDGIHLQRSASIGIAFSGSGDDGPESLIRRADFAMYAAKHADGAPIRVVDHDAQTGADRNAQLAEDLQGAAQRGEMRLDYQPIAQARNGRVVGAEALLRWQHPQEGLIPPGVFIPIAERSGLIKPLGDWVLHQACTDFVRWRRIYGPALTSVAINVSPHQVLGPGFSQSIAKAMEATGIDPSAVHVEITESLELHDVVRARTALKEVTDLGLHLSLGDFGTGHSSLSYLQRLPFTSLKINRSFVANLTGPDAVSVAIVTALVNLAHALGQVVIAEGVETPEQLHRVIELGCDLVQGFWLSYPLSASELERTVLDRAEPALPVHLPV